MRKPVAIAWASVRKCRPKGRRATTRWPALHLRAGQCIARTEGWERRFWLYPAGGLADLAEKVSGVHRARQDPRADPMFDFDERDLVRFAEAAGFFPVELELRIELRAADPQPWGVFLNSSGNPKMPTFAEAMEEALSSAERGRVAAHLRPLVEEGRGVWRMARAYLWATEASPLTITPTVATLPQAPTDRPIPLWDV